MARLFELPETKGTFQVKGIINGVKRDSFYTAKKTKTNKDRKAVNFGCEYDTKKSVYLNLSGMPQDKVYFSKKDPKTQKSTTKPVNWAARNTFNEAGFRLIGVNLGLTKTTDAEGKLVNDKKTMHAFDACDYIKENLKDGMSTFIRGNIEFSSFMDEDDNIIRKVQYAPTQISLCKEVDFSEYTEENKPNHDFTQTIVFMGIDKEKANEKDTGRFIVSAKIVTYSDIIDTEFVVIDAKLANLFRTKLKPYMALSVHGRLETVHGVQEVTEEDAWGETNTMNSVNNSSKTEMVITGATPSTIDRESYTEKGIDAAIKAIRNAKTAEQKFSGKATTTDDDADAWGDVADGSDDDDTPWD